MRKTFRTMAVAGAAALALLAAGCGSSAKEAPAKTSAAASVATPVAAKAAKVDMKAANKAGVGVNKFIWRASLDTLSFMPLLTADPYGGTIITDWHSTAKSPNERLKVQAYILAKELRADALRITVFRQELKQNTWHNAPVANETKIKLENAILARARQLKVGDLDD
jgi:hypothetical protein